MNEHENFSAEAEARRDRPARPRSPGESQRQDMLLRCCLAAVATAAAGHAGSEAQALTGPVGGTTRSRPSTALPPPSSGRGLVREAMEVPAAALREDLPYRDIARLPARDQVGALPVVDDEDLVVGVVPESDVLAKVAFEASGHRPGPMGRLRERRLYGKARGETAADLMTSPAITVLPGATVAEAAWLRRCPG
ncbi:CBS domain-containing protein [Streptomyces sp. NPDC086777]|uniref:CBS domain-containing protein n=1 Tax=Streptomyces sp. NPDC086777 TaxID=3154866 RepID=UPI00344D897A